MGKIASAP
jgi:hypothetical protein